MQKHSLALQAFYVFHDPDFPALLLINSAAFESTEKSSQNYTFAVKSPKPPATLNDIRLFQKIFSCQSWDLHNFTFFQTV